MDPHFDGVIFQTHAEELQRRLAFDFPPFAVLDVRPVASFRAGTVPGALSASLESLESLPDGVTEETEVIVLGEGPTDPTIRAASERLRELGVHRVVELPGGLHEWLHAGFELQAPDS